MNKHDKEKAATAERSRESRLVIGRALERAKDVDSTWTPESVIGVASWRGNSGTRPRKAVFPPESD